MYSTITMMRGRALARHSPMVVVKEIQPILLERKTVRARAKPNRSQLFESVKDKNPVCWMQTSST
ncbi:unnamed protein product [Staurois parvus]|uniref:Uncharacterized protein n=1 Tax=Staurois parvus TaxID=386267 RepID=A0ABN9HKN3_9NEOB|nr:unnamed protein product [Staurois parvus]